MRARKKPVEVEFWYLPTTKAQVNTVGGIWKDPRIEVHYDYYDSVLYAQIQTLEGRMKMTPEDHVLIKGVKDELYPCAHDIFDKTYEVIPEQVEGKI